MLPEAHPKTPVATPKPETPPCETVIRSGTCYVIFAYDVGFSIDLNEAQRRIATASQRKAIRHKRRAPHYFAYQPPPLHVTQTASPVSIGRFITDAAVDTVIFDFGAVSVCYTLPLAGPLEELLALSDELYDHPALLEQSRQGVAALLDAIRPAVHKPEMPDRVEDYAIYQLSELSPATTPEAALAAQRGLFARILRAESTELSTQEVEDALACQLSFGREDRAVIDWNAALLFDREAEDVRAVLEYANVELLELRYLDDQLDEALDQAYEAMSKRRGRYRRLSAKARDMWGIAELQIDSAILFEGVNNALKLLGDQYLARVYRMTSQRFHLADWDASILRKLQTIESIYEKISDRQNNWRFTVLEWIIIALIALEVVLMLVMGL